MQGMNTCKRCKKPFPLLRKNQKYCSRNCRIEANYAKNKILSGKAWREIEAKLKRLAKLESPQFRRYLRYESRINVWLKANKK